MTQAAKRRLFDTLIGAAVGAACTGLLTAFTLYIEVKDVNSRLTRLEADFRQITRVEVRNHTQHITER